MKPYPCSYKTYNKWNKFCICWTLNFVVNFKQTRKIESFKTLPCSYGGISPEKNNLLFCSPSIKTACQLFFVSSLLLLDNNFVKFSINSLFSKWRSIDWLKFCAKGANLSRAPGNGGIIFLDPDWLTETMASSNCLIGNVTKHIPWKWWEIKSRQILYVLLGLSWNKIT